MLPNRNFQAAAVRSARKKLVESNLRLKGLRNIKQNIQQMRNQTKQPIAPMTTRRRLDNKNGSTD